MWAYSLQIHTVSEKRCLMTRVIPSSEAEREIGISIFVGARAYDLQYSSFIGFPRNTIGQEGSPARPLARE